MKLIVMGAGYVGMALLQDLQHQLHEIFITTTREEHVEQLKSYGKDVLVLDKDDSSAFNTLINSCDGIVVLVAPKDSNKYNETYLGTAKTIVAAISNRDKPFYIVYTSSTSVCEGLQTWVTEETTLNPQSANPKILLETEEKYLDSNATVCVLRLGGIYGPGRELQDRAKRFSDKEMSGTGLEATNHIHLEDIVGAINYCIENRLKGLYHLVNDDHPTRKELYNELCVLGDLPLPKWDERAKREVNVGYKVSNEKIKDVGYKFMHPHITLR